MEHVHNIKLDNGKPVYIFKCLNKVAPDTVEKKRKELEKLIGERVIITDTNFPFVTCINGAIAVKEIVEIEKPYNVVVYRKHPKYVWLLPLFLSALAISINISLLLYSLWIR